MTSPGYPLLGGISAEQFLQEYWQKKPLFIKDSLTSLGNPLPAEEVAGLACEDFIESRLITRSAEFPHWHLQHGPFSEPDFQGLPEQDWTLHIQAVDRWLADVYRLLDLCDFLPHWRLDDIMISLSTDGGSAGPHFDQYDVFLVQTEGNKRWQLGGQCDEHTPLQASCDLLIVETFDAEQSFIAEPGDVLYIPPGVAHYGVSEGTSITYSIGCRAPAYHELRSGFSGQNSDTDSEYARYQDPDLTLPTSPGELDDTALTQVQAILGDLSVEAQDVAHWFGVYITAHPDDQALPERLDTPLDWDQVENALRASSELYWCEGSRFVFYVGKTDIAVFINGQHYPLPLAARGAVELLCNRRVIAAADVLPAINSDDDRQWLVQLLNAGLLFCDGL